MSARSRRKLRGRIEKQRRGPLASEESQHLESLKRKFEQRRPGRNLVVVEPPGVQKMSEVLEDFVEPFRYEAETEVSFRALISLGVLAWNASFVPPKEQRAMADRIPRELFPEGPSEAQAEVQSLFLALLERKQTHFAKNRRTILEFNVSPTSAGLHLSVISAQPVS
jgi:hypothetical protein